MSILPVAGLTVGVKPRSGIQEIGFADFTKPMPRRKWPIPASFVSNGLPKRQRLHVARLAFPAQGAEDYTFAAIMPFWRA